MRDLEDGGACRRRFLQILVDRVLGPDDQVGCGAVPRGEAHVARETLGALCRIARRGAGLHDGDAHGVTVGEGLLQAPLAVDEDAYHQAQRREGREVPALPAQRGRERRRDAGVDRRDDEAEPVRPGEIGDLDQRAGAHLRVREKPPRIAEVTVRTRELAGDPAAGDEQRMCRAAAHQPRHPRRVGGHVRAVQRPDERDRSRASSTAGESPK